MKINPYLFFNGKAAEAIALYEKAFGGKAIVSYYKDAAQYDTSYVIPAGTEDYVMHARLNLGSEAIMLCDTPEPCGAGDTVQLSVLFDAVKQVKQVFDVLKQGGAVVMEPQKTFWSECYASVKDKFGITWLLSYETEAQQKQSFGT